MPSTYTGLGTQLMATGENAGTWGTKTNTNLNIIEQISGGYLSQALNTTGATTLAVSDGAATDANQVGHRILNFTAALAGNVTVTIPLDVEQFYIIKNSTTNAYSVEFKYVTGSGGSVTWASGDRGTKIVYATANDGTNPDIIDATSAFVTATSTTTLTNKTLTSPKINEDVVCSSTATELNLLDGCTASTTELNYSDLTTLGTSAASKVLTADANNLTTVSGAVLNTEDTLTDAADIVWNVVNSPVAKVTLTANRNLSAPTGTGIAAGQFVSILIIQDAGGTNTVTWNAVYEFPSDTAPTLTSTGDLGDLFTFRYNGAKWLLVGQTLALTLA